MCNRDRLVQQRLSAFKPHRQVWTILLHLRDKALPVIARSREILLLHHPAKVRNATFHRLNAPIASGIEHQFRGARQLSRLPGRKAVIHLEGHPSLRVFWPWMAAKIVLAAGEK